jgi:hypothetical protein
VGAIVRLMGCPWATPDKSVAQEEQERAHKMAQETRARFRVALFHELGGEANAARVHAEFQRIRAQYHPHQVPGEAEAGPGERAAVDRWERAYGLAMEAAFSLWPNLAKGASVEVKFVPTYRIQVRRGPIGGYTGDRVRSSIPCGEYIVDHDGSRLVFRDADARGGGRDLTVDLAEFDELAAFPEDLDGTQLEVIGPIGVDYGRKNSANA